MEKNLYKWGRRKKNYIEENKIKNICLKWWNYIIKYTLILYTMYDDDEENM